jgi:hypothetical protein
MKRKINQKQLFCVVAGVVLFCVGLFGYAFRTGFHVPDSYLLLNLGLGFWGIVAGLWSNKN